MTRRVASPFLSFSFCIASPKMNERSFLFYPEATFCQEEIQQANSNANCNRAFVSP
jgi:hypothetical protein